MTSGIDTKKIADLTAHLDDVARKLAAGTLSDACDRVDRFISRVDTVANGPHPPISAATAADWITRAQAVGTSIAC